MWGPTGSTRMFNAEFGGQISWLLPGRAASCSSPGSRVTATRPRTDRTRAALVLWGGWLVVTGARVQPRQGDHPPVLHGRPRAGDRRARRHRRRHAVEAAPRREARGGARGRRGRHRRLGLRPARTHPTVEPVVARTLLLVGVLVAGALLAAHLVTAAPLVALALAAIAVVLAAPAGYTLSTVTPPHTGAIPTAGPAGASSMGIPGGGPGGFRGAAERWSRADVGAPAAGGFRSPPRADRRRTVRGAAAGCSTGARRARRCGSCSTLTAARTPGSRPPSARTRPPATSSPPTTRHGDRRLQRHRPDADPGPVPAVRARGPDPLLHRRRRLRRLRRRRHHEHVGADLVVGRAPTSPAGPSAA